jgi:hypothetical protein
LAFHALAIMLNQYEGFYHAVGWRVI